MRHFHSATLGVLLTLLFAGASFAQSNTPSNDILSFADHLYAQKDYYRAITEYKRFLFLNPTSPLAPAAECQIGMSYMNGEKLELAVQAFSDLADRHIKDALGQTALLMEAESYALLKQYREAQGTLETFLARYPDATSKDAITLKLCWYLLCQGENELAKERIRGIAADSSLHSQSERLMTAAMAYDDIPQKSPMLAGCFSAVLPGAGQLYTGRPRDGLLAFFINGCLIWAATEAFDKDQNFSGGMFVLLDASWYAGNIYNAANDANKYNRKSRQNFLDDTNVKCGLTLSRNGESGSAPALALQLSF